MSNVLILGANGGIARIATELFLKETQARLTLGLRKSGRLMNSDARRMRVIECDALDLEDLKQAMVGQDVVYANLAGDLERMARNICHRSLGPRLHDPETRMVYPCG